MNQKSFFPAAKSVQIEFLNNVQLAYRRVRTARVRRYCRPVQAGLGSPEHARVTTAAGRMLPVGARNAHFQGFRLRIGTRREAGRGGYGRNQGGLKPQSSARQWRSRRMSSAVWPAGAGFSAHDRAARCGGAESVFRFREPHGIGQAWRADARHGARKAGPSVCPPEALARIDQPEGGWRVPAGKACKIRQGLAAARLPSRSEASPRQ